VVSVVFVAAPTTTKLEETEVVMVLDLEKFQFLPHSALCFHPHRFEDDDWLWGSKHGHQQIFL
jgi:hypothetical protein